MKSAHFDVAKILLKDVALQRDLSRGVINIRALARYLKETYDLSYSNEAIISAIRRFDIEGFAERETTVFQNMSVTTKDKVVSVLLKEEVFKQIAEDYIGDGKLRANFRLIRSKEKMLLILSEKDIDGKLELFWDQDIVEVRKDLAEIRIEFGKDITLEKGLLAQLMGELTLYGINVEHSLFLDKEVYLYVKKDDLLEAHKAILTLKMV
jgi:hypothetical protein